MLMNATGQTWPVNTEFGNKFHVDKAHQELEIVNTGTNTVHVDLYEYYCKKVIQQSRMISLLANVPPAWTNASGTAIGNVSTGVSPFDWFQQDVGVDPFDFEDVVNHLKITRKTKVLIEGGQSVTFNKSCNKFVYNGDEDSQQPTYTRCADKLSKSAGTKGYILVVAGSAVTDSSEPCTLSIMTTNEYVCRPIATALQMQTTTKLP